jgi:hypothetical protein
MEVHLNNVFRQMPERVEGVLTLSSGQTIPYKMVTSTAYIYLYCAFDVSGVESGQTHEAIAGLHGEL